jgi:integration host factor subunit alpha
VHHRVGLSRTEAARLVNSVIDALAEAVVAGEPVKLSSFGTFEVRQKVGRVGRNPRTGIEVPITPRHAGISSVMLVLDTSIQRKH